MHLDDEGVSLIFVGEAEHEVTQFGSDEREQVPKGSRIIGRCWCRRRGYAGDARVLERREGVSDLPNKVHLQVKQAVVHFRFVLGWRTDELRYSSL